MTEPLTPHDIIHRAIGATMSTLAQHVSDGTPIDEWTATVTADILADLWSNGWHLTMEGNDADDIGEAEPEALHHREPTVADLIVGKVWHINSFEGNEWGIYDLRLTACHLDGNDMADHFRLVEHES